MPGPLSIPNGVNRMHKFTEGERVYWVATEDLTGEQRAYLARLHQLDTGKTAKKKRKG